MTTAIPPIYPLGQPSMRQWLSSSVKALREADWITERRVCAYSRISLAIYIAVILIMLALSSHCIDPMGRPLGIDFLAVWSAGHLALDGHAPDTYNFEKMFASQSHALPWQPGQYAPFFPWPYPPTFSLVAAALALLPYGVALAVWMAVTLPVYLGAISGILPGRKARLAALAFPAGFVNLTHGQNGFLTAGLLGGGLVLLERRPWISGILLGLAAYKPQLALLLPLALLAGRHGRALFAAAATAMAAAAISWGIFGGETWQAFFLSLTASRTVLLEQGASGWEKIHSAFSAVRMFGGSVPLAYAVQAVFSCCGAAAVVWAWRKPGAPLFKAAVLATAMLLASPYLFDYDLIVLAIPIAWLAAAGLRDGFLPWEKTMLLGISVLPLLSRSMARVLHLPIVPIAILLVLVILVRRAVQTPAAHESLSHGARSFQPTAP